MSNKLTVSCIWCLFIYDWTWIDAVVNTMIKEIQNDKFLNAKFRDCHNCIAKRRLETKQWKLLYDYYSNRGIH